jgi:hypothetical protein
VLEVEDDLEDTDALDLLSEREKEGRYIAEAIVFVLWCLGLG